MLHELVAPGRRRATGLETVATQVFASAADLVATVAGSGLEQGVQAVLYDPEGWDMTPVDEQLDPVAATARAAAVARGHGLRLLVAPALSLVTTMAPRSRESRWERYLDLGLGEGTAAHADLLVVQAQSLERDPAVYRQFVRAVADRVRKSRPGTALLAGLSTNPPGGPLEDTAVARALDASRDLVDGWWMNIPERGPHCPTCGDPRPHRAVAALRGQ